MLRPMGESTKHHRLDYLELPVDDLAAAKAFYGAAFGWEFTDYGPGPDYVGIKGGDGEDEIGGFRLDPDATSGGPLPILFSDNLDGSLQAVRIAGGEIAIGPYDFPGGRRFHFHDPSGNELAVWSPAGA